MPNQSAKRKTLFSLQNYGSSNGYAVSGSNVGITGTNPCSMIQWVMPQRLIGAFQVAAAVGTPGGAAGTSYILAIDASNKYVARLGSTISAVGPVAQPMRAVPLILTSNGSRLRLYVGQAFLAEVAITPNIGNAPLIIGSDLTSGTPAPFFGLLSTPIVCNAELTQDEVRDYVTAGVVPASAILHYAMGLGGGAGSVLTDAIGTNHGTITGLLWHMWTPFQERKRVIPAKSALRLDGSTGYIPLGTHASYAIGNAGWLKGKFTLDKVQVDTNTANNRFVLTLSDGTLNNFITVIVRNSAPYELLADCRSLGASKSFASTGATTLGLLDGIEHDVLLTWDSTSADLYLDGKLVATRVEDMRVSALASGTPDMVSGRLNSGINARYLTGELRGLAYGNAKLTPQEVYDNVYFGKSIASQVGAWGADDVGGPTLNVVGSGNAATIGGTTSWVKKAGARKTPNENLIYNGDFEIAPPFVAATSGNGRWVDGTSGGSPSNNVPGWSMPSTPTGTGEARFDSAVFSSGSKSMKVSIKATGSSTGVSSYLSNTPSNQMASGIPVSPSTTYTIRYRIKTTVISGSAVSGAFLVLREQSNTGSTVTTTSGVKINTTTDWTEYQFSITTNATTRFLAIDLNVKGNDGSATLIMDAWFDNLVLLPAFPTRRVPVNPNMVENGDFEVAPVFVAAQTASNFIDGTAAGSASNRSFKWWGRNRTTSMSVQYDPTVSHSGGYSIKGSTLNATGTFQISNFNTVSPTLAQIQQGAIRVMPNTLYELRMWVKTNNVATNAVSGAVTTYKEDGTGGSISSSPTSLLSGTNDWTELVKTFTTGPADAWLQVNLNNIVAGNVSETWFDDISVKAVGGVALRPISFSNPYAIRYNGVDAYGLASAVGFAEAAKVTIAGWVRVIEPTQPTAAQIALETSANYNTTDGFILAFNQQGVASERQCMAIAVRDSSVNATYSAAMSNPLVQGRLYRCLFTIDQALSSAQVQIYMDGVPNLLRRPFDGNTKGGINTNDLYFGARGGASLFLSSDFVLDYIVTGKTFTAAEVLSEFQTGVRPSGGTLLMRPPTTEGQGASIADASGNNYNIALSGKFAWEALATHRNRRP